MQRGDHPQAPATLLKEMRYGHERALAGRQAGRQCWWGSGDLLEKVANLPWVQAGETTREAGGSAVRYLEGGCASEGRESKVTRLQC